MKASVPNVSERRLRSVVVPRSALWKSAAGRSPRLSVIDDVLAARLARILRQHTTYGYRRLCALLRLHEGAPINYQLRHRFVTPYTLGQNGMIERSFRSLKEKRVAQRSFLSFAEARAPLDRLLQRLSTASTARLSESASASRGQPRTRS